VPFIRVGGLSFRYQVTGRGQPLLLLGGFGRSIEHWLDLEPALGKTFTVISLDLRGSGGSDAPIGRYSTAKMADEAAEIMKCIGFGEGFHVFGLSLGGMVAQELAIRHPDRVNRLILAATSAGNGPGFQTPVISGAGLGAMLLAATLPTPTAIRLTAHWISAPGFISSNSGVADRWHGIYKRWPPKPVGLAGQIAAASQHHTVERLGMIRSETLVLHGDADRFITPAAATLIASRIPRSHMKWFVGAGHDLAAERPKELEWHIRDFLVEALPVPADATNLTPSN